MKDPLLEQGQKLLADLQAFGRWLGVPEREPSEDPYDWLKDTNPKFYKQLHKSRNKSLKKKAKEEAKKRARIRIVSAAD